MASTEGKIPWACRLASGVAIPAFPLALHDDGSWAEQHQRALVRYYHDAGAGGLAVGVHSTQFEIREPQHALYEPAKRTIASMENASPKTHTSGRPRLPEWLRVNLPSGREQSTFNSTQLTVLGNELHTVCEEARCPNIHDCWARGTATFMVAGKECTRGCRFCSVETLREPPPLEVDEPKRLADAVERMQLEHVVITVVNRDDLPDGGADHYKQCVMAVKNRLPETDVELLSSDLDGNWQALAHLLDGIPLAVFAHNVECVSRLDSLVRDPRASFSQSLEVLERAKNIRADIWTKSSIMVGLGETDEEVTTAMHQLREVGVELLTLGQYLAPGRPGTRFLPVDRYVHPDQFAEWEEQARTMGFRGVAAGPLVRSSYRAGLLMHEAETGEQIKG